VELQLIVHAPTGAGTGNTPPVSPPQGNPGGTCSLVEEGEQVEVVEHRQQVEYDGALVAGAGGAGTDTTPILGSPGLPNSGVYAGGGANGSRCPTVEDQ
jgi:hypothetical protein